MILKELIAKIGFDVDKSKLDGVEKQLEGIHHLLEAFAAVEIIKGIVEMTEKFGEMAEQIHLSAISAGITTEAFQKLAFAAQQTGVSQEELGGAMAKISKHLYDARMGSEEAQKVFLQAGFTADQVRSFKNGSEVLHALSDRFKGMKDPIKEIGILMPLAGRGSRQMIEFMQQGSAGMKALEDQAESLGAVLSDGQVEALVSVQHAAMALGSVLKTLGASIAADFAPSVETAIKEFLEFYKVNKDLLQLEVKKWVWDITYALGAVWAIVKFVAQGFLDFARTHEVLVRRVGELVLAISGLVSIIFLLKSAWGVAAAVMGPTLSMFTLFKNALIFVRFALSGVLEFIGYLTKAEWALNAAIAVTEAPLWAIAAGIGAIVLAANILWTLLSGGSLKDTWLGEFVEYIGHLGFVAKAIAMVKDLLSGGGKMLDLASQSNGAAGPGGAMQGIQNLWNVGGLASGSTPAPSPLAAAAGAPGSTANVDINAPMTIQIHEAHDPKAVAEKVQTHVSDHLARVQREAQRSLRPAQSY